MIGAKNLSSAYVLIDYVMGFGLEQEDGSLITPMAGTSSPSHQKQVEE